MKFESPRKREKEAVNGKKKMILLAGKVLEAWRREGPSFLVD